MSLFWATDTGSITTRFSQDFQFIDSTLPLAMMSVASSASLSYRKQQICLLTNVYRSPHLYWTSWTNSLCIRVAGDKFSSLGRCVMAGPTFLSANVATAPSSGPGGEITIVVSTVLLLGFTWYLRSKINTTAAHSSLNHWRALRPSVPSIGLRNTSITTITLSTGPRSHTTYFSWSKNGLLWSWTSLSQHSHSS